MQNKKKVDDINVLFFQDEWTRYDVLEVQFDGQEGKAKGRVRSHRVRHGLKVGHGAEVSFDGQEERQDSPQKRETLSGLFFVGGSEHAEEGQVVINIKRLRAVVVAQLIE